MKSQKKKSEQNEKNHKQTISRNVIRMFTRILKISLFSRTSNLRTYVDICEHTYVKTYIDVRTREKAIFGGMLVAINTTFFLKQSYKNIILQTPRQLYYFIYT